MEQLSVENPYAGLIRQEKLLIISGCKKKHQAKVILLLMILKYL